MFYNIIVMIYCYIDIAGTYPHQTVLHVDMILRRLHILNYPVHVVILSTNSLKYIDLQKINNEQYLRVGAALA